MEVDGAEVAAAMVARADGWRTTSASTNASHSVVALSAPARHARGLPIHPGGNAPPSRVITEAPAAAASAPVPSDEPSSTTTTSVAWSSTDATHPATTVASSRAGITTRTSIGGAAGSTRRNRPAAIPIRASPTRLATVATLGRWPRSRSVRALTPRRVQLRGLIAGWTATSTSGSGPSST